MAILTQAILAILVKMAKIDIMGWPDMATNMVNIGFDANSRRNVDHQ